MSTDCHKEAFWYACKMTTVAALVFWAVSAVLGAIVARLVHISVVEIELWIAVAEGITYATWALRAFGRIWWAHYKGRRP